MVSGAELAVIGTIAGSVIGGGFGIVQSKIQEDHQNERQWTQLVFERKFDLLLELQSQFDQTGILLLDTVSVDDVVTADFDVEKAEYEELKAQYVRLADAWADASLLIDAEHQDELRRGLHLFYTIISEIAVQNGYDGPISRIHYDGTVELDSPDDFHGISTATQDSIRRELMRPVDELKR